MTAPRQHTDTPDPNLIPADQVMQSADDAGAPAQHQRPDPSAEQSSPPPATTRPADAQASTPPAAEQHKPASGDALFGEQDLSELRTRWIDVQATFVDDPRDCVQRADGLVSSAVEQLTASFASTRSRLEEQWSRGEEASTEDLRLALKQYRDFFDRLLAV
jgi:hypothetical protein